MCWWRKRRTLEENNYSLHAYKWLSFPRILRTQAGVAWGSVASMASRHTWAGKAGDPNWGEGSLERLRVCWDDQNPYCSLNTTPCIMSAGFMKNRLQLRCLSGRDAKWVTLIITITVFYGNPRSCVYWCSWWVLPYYRLWSKFLHRHLIMIFLCNTSPLLLPSLKGWPIGPPSRNVQTYNCGVLYDAEHQ